MAFDISEIMVLYEISSFLNIDDEDKLMQDIIEKSSRLLGVQRLAVFKHRKNKLCCVGKWGFREDEDVPGRAGNNKDNTFLFSNNRVFLYFEQGYPLTDKEKRLYRVFSQRIQQILDHIQINRALKESDRRYRELFNGSRDGFVVVNAESGILDANRAFCNMLGYTLEELCMLDNFYEITPEKWHVWEKEEIWNRHLLTEGYSGIYEKEYIRKDGTVFPVELHAFTVFADNGSPRYLWAVVRDITERKHADEKINRLYRQLDDEVNKAVTIHKRILPGILPGPDNISFAAHYQPAARIGGDLYNVIEAGNKLIIYLSDVMGHGLDGAMLSVFVKEAINSYVALKPEDIGAGALLDHVAGQFHIENFPYEYLVCILLGILDLETMEFTYVTAGFQTPPLVSKENGGRFKLDCDGIFISNSLPREILNYRERSILLETGTTIFFTTDGLVEQGKAGEWFYQRYEEIFYENSHLPPEIIVQAINNGFYRFNNNSLTGDDDITFLVMQYRPKKNKLHFEVQSDLNLLEPLYEEIREVTVAFPHQDNLITCLHELVANAMEHGNRLDPAQKVTIELTVSENFVIAEVEDQGKGFNWCEKLNKKFDLGGLSERGRGIPMTRIMSGNLFYNQKGNRATLVVQARH